MTIRLATIEDLDLIVEMAMKFVQETNYKDHSNEESIRTLAAHILNSPKEKAVVLISPHGMLAGTVAPFLFGTGTTATELAWWIDPDHRGSSEGAELLEAFEYWAKRVGCKLITMISLAVPETEHDRVGKFYEKKGYVLQERTYAKEI